MKKLFSILRKRDPLLQLLAILSTNIGNGMQILAAGMLLYSKTASAASFGMLFVFEYFTSFLFQLSAGALNDRGHAKFSAFYAELFRGIFILLALVPLAHGQVYFIFLISLFTNLLKPFYRTASFVMAPLIAPGEELLAYNSLCSMMLQVGVFIGAAVTGLLLIWYSPVVIIGINGISYLLSALLIAFSSVPGQTVRTSLRDGRLGQILTSLLSWQVYAEELRGIVTDVRTAPAALLPAILCAMDFVVIAISNVVFLPLLRCFGLGKQWISYWDAAFAVGAIAGAFLAMSSARHGDQTKIRLWPALFAQSALFALAPLVLKLLTPAPTFALWMFALGVANGYSIPMFVFIGQVRAPGKRLGRASCLRQLAIASLSLLSVPLLSSMTDTLHGLKIVFILMAGGTALFSVLSKTLPQLFAGRSL